MTLSFEKNLLEHFPITSFRTPVRGIPRNIQELTNTIHKSEKRKKLSPTGEVIVSRALKLRKRNSPSTPVVRGKLIKEQVRKETEKSLKQVDSMGGVVIEKRKRKIRNPKRCLIPGQLLITSTFSPKVKNPGKREEEKDKEELDTGREDLSNEKDKGKGC